MQLEDGEIEDGEIEEDFSGDVLNPYTPLERPTICNPVKDEPHEESDKESEGKYSSSESDDDFRPKKAKLRRTVPLPIQPKKKKYSIWCRDPNEHLTDFLDSFGMRKPENDRSVENYMCPSFFDRKRKVPVRNSLLGSAKLDPITLDDLEVTENDTFECVAKDISTKLSEENYDLVLRIVVICGKKVAIKLYNRTKQIESDGGLLIANKSRRRTSGGIFILLVRREKSITSSQKKEIFEDGVLKGKIGGKKAKKLEQKRKYKEWLEKMNSEKDESGQEELLNNPPPSPEPHCPEPLPELRLRRELISYGSLNIQHSTDSEDGQFDEKESAERNASVLLHRLSDEARARAGSSPRHREHSDSPVKRDVVDYEDLCSMELIYD